MTTSRTNPPQCVAQRLLQVLILLSVPIIVTANREETLIGVTGKDFVMLGYSESVSSNIVVTSSEVDKVHVIREPSNSGETVVVAAAGELPDVEALVSQLQAQASMQDFADMTDVTFVDLKQSESETLRYGVAPANPTQGLSVVAIAKLARFHIARNLRTATPFRVGLLVAGMQTEKHPMFGVTRKRTLAGTNLDFVAGPVQQQLQRSTSLNLDDNKNGESEDAEANDATSKTKTTTPHLYWLDEYGSLQKIWYGSHGLGSYFVLAILDQGFRKNLTRKQASELIQKCFDQLETRYTINSPKSPVIKCVDKEGCRVYRP